MEEKQVKINVPDGYEIDKKNSTFECIKFKKKESRFSDYDGHHYMSGVFIGSESNLHKLGIDYNSINLNTQNNKNVFVSREAAKSALAFAQIGQIRKNETDRYGCLLSTNDTHVYRIGVTRTCNLTVFSNDLVLIGLSIYLSFDTKEHADLFLKENSQLIKDYFIID